MDPFVVNEESKVVVLGNNAYLLSSFLECSLYENVLFCWVMQEQEIIDEVLNRLTACEYELSIFTLTCSVETLCHRLKKDIHAGIRTEAVIARSLNRLSLYSRMHTKKIDTTELSAAETAQIILAKLELSAGKSNA